MGQTAFAEGDGTGGGKSEPLTLVSASINDGATGVSLKPEIKLTFSKNIVNMSVNESNKNCFSLLTASGTAIPINLVLADDQIDFEKRNDAIITPKANLEQGTTYSVVVSSTLKAKSGVTTGKEIRLTFTTEGTKAAPSNNNNNNPSKTTPKPETPAPKGETTTKPESVKPKVENTPKADSKKNENTTSKVVEKAPTEQNTAETQTKTTEDTPAVEEQPHEDTAKQETVVSAAEPENVTPYVAATTTNKEKVETQSSNSNTFIYILVSSLIVIIAAISIYLRKKRVKSVSR
ncbi:Ig-like domain-containing protein [Neobacillus novalis]|uniref:Ig-like domain-containing protein n=2 Tax=Neobacillus novalis TaxID=220687 RepID=A0AA95MRC3_9BACI|nr:Ig-like domain-containing protein [Neobacillus novalis]WHY86994.1 Ig-like domain-containing protein [Neobacillus novalis]